MGDFAEKSRALLAACRFGVLSTQSKRLEGFPFGSLVNYALDGEGRPLLLLSGLAVHTKNLLPDARASFLVFNSSAAESAVTAERLTLVGEIRLVPTADEAAAKVAFLERHPEAIDYIGFGDFAMYRMAIADTYYVGGFGEMGWTSKLT